MNQLLDNRCEHQPLALEPGALIRVNRILYNHIGIYVGARSMDQRDVIHNDIDGGVVLATLTEFSAGKPVSLHKAAPADHWQRQAIVNRAFLLLGRRYDLLTFNCEHAASWASIGKAESPQLVGVFIMLAVMGGLALVCRKE